MTRNKFFVRFVRLVYGYLWFVYGLLWVMLQWLRWLLRVIMSTLRVVTLQIDTYTLSILTYCLWFGVRYKSCKMEHFSFSCIEVTSLHIYSTVSTSMAPKTNAVNKESPALWKSTLRFAGYIYIYEGFKGRTGDVTFAKLWTSPVLRKYGQDISGFSMG